VRAERDACGDSGGDGSDLMVPFIRGDSNADGLVNISDPITTVLFLFTTKPLTCLRAADSDLDGSVMFGDVVATLTCLFQARPPIDLPFPGCGTDPNADALTCENFGPCE
jgi:hypothetical protein